MSMSISGQNERWAQLGVYQPPPSSQQGQNVGWGFGSAPAATSGTNGSTAVAGASSGPLSDGVSFALMALSGGSDSEPVTASQTAVQSNGTSAAASPDSASATQSGGSLETQLLKDMQSLISALTETGRPSTGNASASGTAATGTANNLDSSVAQGLRTVASDLNTIASVSGPAQQGSTGGPPPGDTDISNSGTNAAGKSTGAWKPSYSDGFRQQFAMSAYNAGAQSALTGSATSSLASINA